MINRDFDSISQDIFIRMPWKHGLVETLIQQYKSSLEDHMWDFERRISCQHAQLSWLGFWSNLGYFFGLVQCDILIYDPSGECMLAVFSGDMKLEEVQVCWKTGLVFKRILTNSRKKWMKSKCNNTVGVSADYRARQLVMIIFQN